MCVCVFVSRIIAIITCALEEIMIIMDYIIWWKMNL